MFSQHEIDTAKDLLRHLEMTRTILVEMQEDLLSQLRSNTEQLEKANAATIGTVAVLQLLTGAKNPQEVVDALFFEELKDNTQPSDTAHDDVEPTQVDLPSDVAELKCEDDDCPLTTQDFPLPDGFIEVDPSEKPKRDWMMCSNSLGWEEVFSPSTWAPNMPHWYSLGYRFAKPAVEPTPEPETPTQRRWCAISDCCIECHRTDRPHEAHGRCKACDGRWRRSEKNRTTQTPAQLAAKAPEDNSKVVDVPKPTPNPEVGKPSISRTKTVLDLYPVIVASSDRQKFSLLVRAIRNAELATVETTARDILRETTDTVGCTLHQIQAFKATHAERFKKFAKVAGSSEVSGLLADWYRDMEIEAATL